MILASCARPCGAILRHTHHLFRRHVRRHAWHALAHHAVMAGCCAGAVALGALAPPVGADGGYAGGRYRAQGGDIAASADDFGSAALAPGGGEFASSSFAPGVPFIGATESAPPTQFISLPPGAQSFSSTPATPVPEPSSLAVMAAAVLLVVGLRRYRATGDAA